jgi:alpha-mannosidase
MCSHQAHNSASSAHGYPVSNLGAGEKWIKNLTKNRLGTFLGGHFSGVNLSSVLFKHQLDSEENVKLEVWSAPGRTKPSFEEAMKQEFKPAKKGDRFGPSCGYQPALRVRGS